MCTQHRGQHLILEAELSLFQAHISLVPDCLLTPTGIVSNCGSHKPIIDTNLSILFQLISNTVLLSIISYNLNLLQLTKPQFKGQVGLLKLHIHSHLRGVYMYVLLWAGSNNYSPSLAMAISVVYTGSPMASSMFGLVTNCCISGPPADGVSTQYIYIHSVKPLYSGHHWGLKLWPL